MSKLLQRPIEGVLLRVRVEPAKQVRSRHLLELVGLFPNALVPRLLLRADRRPLHFCHSDLNGDRRANLRLNPQSRRNLGPAWLAMDAGEAHWLTTEERQWLQNRLDGECANRERHGAYRTKVPLCARMPGFRVVNFLRTGVSVLRRSTENRQRPPNECAKHPNAGSRPPQIRTIS
jgi:hypothetical protein